MLSFWRRRRLIESWPLNEQCARVWGIRRACGKGGPAKPGDLGTDQGRACVMTISDGRGWRRVALPGGALCGLLFLHDDRRLRRRAALYESAVFAL